MPMLYQAILPRLQFTQRFICLTCIIDSALVLLSLIYIPYLYTHLLLWLCMCLIEVWVYAIAPCMRVAYHINRVQDNISSSIFCKLSTIGRHHVLVDRKLLIERVSPLEHLHHHCHTKVAPLLHQMINSMACMSFCKKSILFKHLITYKDINVLHWAKILCFLHQSMHTCHNYPHRGIHASHALGCTMHTFRLHLCLK